MLPWRGSSALPGGMIEAMDQKLAMLSTVPMFSGCRSGELVEIGKLAEEVVVKAGKVLAKEGSSGTSSS